MTSVQSNTIDAITLIGFLEHTTNPNAILKNVHRALKTDGIVMVQVPHADSFSCKIQSAFPENVFRHMIPISHFQLFSKNSLLQAINLAGFEPIAFWFHGLDIYELLNNISIEKSEIVGTQFYETMHSLMNQLQQVVDENEMSDRLIIIGKKL